MIARFDDLRTGRGVLLGTPHSVASTHDLDGVRPLLAEAEAHARGGSWVAVAVAYEAGPAFDPAQTVHPPEDGLPLAWYAAVDDVQLTEAITRGTGAVDVTGIERRGGADWYGRSVDEIREIIASGSAYQINLTDRLDGTLHGDPLDLYARMATAQRGRFNAYLDLGDHVIVSASPELFFETRGAMVQSRPMKGTIRRSARPHDDADAARQLAASEKDRAENVMITDLLRNDIGRVARIGTVRVPSLLRMERYETVWQLTSTVTGEIEPDVTLVDLFDALFPCGSITGAPKVSAMRHITALEPWARGMYCGAIGLLRPQGADEPRPRSVFSVAIRTAVVRRGNDGGPALLTYGAGGGITADSEPDAENREVDAKAAVLTAERTEFRLLETMRAEDGSVLHLDRHLDRLAGSAHHFDFDIDEAHVRALLEALAADVAGPHRLRLLLARDGTTATTLDPIADEPGPVRLRLAEAAVDSHAELMVHKTSERSVYDEIAAQHPDADDVILWNLAGDVVETCRANLLFRIGGRWCTPPLSSGGLAGVGRAALVHEGSVEERRLTIDELRTVDELHVVSALRGRRAAVLLDGPE
ncbi:MAG: chorismate-binding protein [Ilumatobacteraceae bacterium]